MSMDETVTQSPEGAAPTPLEVASGSRPYPTHLAEERPYKPGVRRVPVDRYFRQEYHDLEVEQLWKKIWQVACREEEIPEIGDYAVYEVANLSFIVVRTGQKEIKAYPNVCLHRGRKLCEFGGKRAEEFRCEYHGWAWHVDGKMKDMTCGWDFPGAGDEVSHLPECSTGIWGGFVFINPDPTAEPLEAYIGELPRHFEGANHDLGKRWKQSHTIVHLEANWKVVQEAFFEAWHVTYTHPHMVRSPGHSHTLGSRWDDFGNWMRVAPSLPTDKQKSVAGWAFAAETEQQVVDQQWDFHMDDPEKIVLQPGQTAAELITRRTREEHRKIIGDAVDTYHDVHMFAGEMVNLFPNLHPWGGFTRIIYKFLPYKNDPRRSIMEVMLLAPWPEDRPRPAPATPHVIEFGEPITNAVELGLLARVFSQDLFNIPAVQQGVEASMHGYVLLSSVNDAPIRHFYDLYDKKMGFEEGDYLAKWQPKK